MANYKTVFEHYPEMRPYMNPQLNMRRGAVMTYRANVQTKQLTTDSRGFRRSIIAGETILVSRISAYDDVDAVLGSSHVFGMGAKSDADTMASRLGEVTNRRVVSLNLPEATTTDLVMAASQVLDPRRLNKIYLFPGGTFSRFCLLGLSSPMDGPPTTFAYSPEEFEQRVLKVDPGQMFDNFVRYQLKGIRRFATFAKNQDIELVIVSERTFFEKQTPTAYELKAELGTPANKSQEARFERHKAYAGRYLDEVIAPLRDEGLLLIDYPEADTIEFIDEFHPSPAAVGKIAEHLVASISGSGTS